MAWSNSVAITVHHAQVAATLTNFPVLFSGYYPQLATVANGGGVTNPNGFDIIFASDSAGASPLSFERVAWNRVTGAIEARVLIPSLSSSVDTTFYILFGNSAITTDQQNRAAVWDANFMGVWHLADSNGLSVLDSTANGNSGIAGNNGVTLPTIASAEFGRGGGSFSSQGIYIPPIALSVFTVSAWINPTSAANSGAYSIYAGSAGGIQFRWNASQFQLVRQQITNVGQSTGTWSFGIWLHGALTYDASGNYQFYVNGAPNGNGNNPQSFNTQNMYLGYASNGEDFSGLIDEIQVSNTVRTAAWIQTEYNNTSSPSTFYSTTLTTSNPSIPWGPFPAPPMIDGIMTDANKAANHQKMDGSMPTTGGSIKGFYTTVWSPAGGAYPPSPYAPPSSGGGGGGNYGYIS